MRVLRQGCGGLAAVGQERVPGSVGDGLAGSLAEHGVDHHHAAVVVERGDDAVATVQVHPRLLHVGHACGGVK